MKKYLATLLFVLCTTLLYAQTSETENREPHIGKFYCEVKGVEKEFKSGLKIIFDFGESVSYNLWGTLSSKLKFVDEKGEDIEFHSMVDAANYMVERGWNFQQAYSSIYQGKAIIHWIFYKDAKNFKEAKKGIITKEEYENINNLLD